MSIKKLYDIFPIEYNNRKLCYLGISDVDSYTDILVSDFYNQYLDFDFRKDIAYDTLKALLTNYALRYAFKGEHLLDLRLLLKKSSNNQIIGGCSIILKDLSDGIVELSYFIIPKHQGKGEAYEMLKELINKLNQSSLEFNKFRITVQDCNGASIKLAKKLGFKEVEVFDGVNTLNKIFHLERL